MRTVQRKRTLLPRYATFRWFVYKLIANRVDPMQVVLAEDHDILPSGGSDSISAEMGNKAKNVNVGQDISAVNISAVAGGLHNATVAGRDINNTIFNTHSGNRYLAWLPITILIMIVAFVFWYARNRLPIPTPSITVVLSTPTQPTPTDEVYSRLP